MAHAQGKKQSVEAVPGDTDTLMYQTKTMSAIPKQVQH